MIGRRPRALGPAPARAPAPAPGLAPATDGARGSIVRAVAVVSAGFLVGLIAGLAPRGDIARACSCLPPPPPPEAMAEATAVFHGRVIGMRWLDEPIGLGVDEAEVTFELFEGWKGAAGTTVSVRTEGLGAMCGYAFRLGVRYIVYAYADDAGHLVTGNCSRTRPFDQVEADSLGPSTPVAPVVDPPGVSCPRCAMPPPPREAMAMADAVFHGWAVTFDQTPTGGGWHRRIGFDVLTWWKGDGSGRVWLDLPVDYWGCQPDEFYLHGRTPSEGYIVYAQRDESSGSLTLAECGRTRPYSADEAAELGPGRPPDTGPPSPSPSPSLSTPTESGEPPATAVATSTPPRPTAPPTASATAAPPFPIATRTPKSEPAGRLFVPYAATAD